MGRGACGDGRGVWGVHVGKGVWGVGRGNVGGEGCREGARGNMWEGRGHVGGEGCREGAKGVGRGQRV